MTKYKWFLVLPILVVLWLTSISLYPTTQAVLAQDEDVTAIEALVADMESAVLAGDGETYATYVDWTDDNFRHEHENWVRDWAEADEAWLVDFSLGISDIEIDENHAVGLLRLQWVTTSQPQRVAEYAVQFTYDDEAEHWLYAGEYWITQETEYFLVHASPGTENAIEPLLPSLPDIYEFATTHYDHIPQRPMEIKIYNSREALVGTVGMSFPPFSGWNEPNESLKTINIDTITLVRIIAHEFTHFLTFDQANHAQPRIPWWLNEGIAQYISAPFDPRGDDFWVGNQLLTVQQWTEDDALAEWSEMSDFWNTDVQYWRYAYPQGYAFVRFVTEEYGEELRNAWLADMALEMDIEEATEVHFEKSFAELDTEFRTWILTFEIQ